LLLAELRAAEALEADRPDEGETEEARAALDDEGQLRDVLIDGLLEGDGQGFAEAGREARPEIVHQTMLARIARSRQGPDRGYGWA
jgi:hypothetical protein